MLYEHYQNLEKKYQEDKDRQAMIEEYKQKDPEAFESKCESVTNFKVNTNYKQFKPIFKCFKSALLT